MSEIYTNHTVLVGFNLPIPSCFDEDLSAHADRIVRDMRGQTGLDLWLEDVSCGGVSPTQVVKTMGDQMVELRREIRGLRRQLEAAVGWHEGVEADNDTLRREIARLTAERDAARREVCYRASNTIGSTPADEAIHRNWKCFTKEGY